jgi:predicted Zn-ribbon and HTH transcriptional regulator
MVFETIDDAVSTITSKFASSPEATSAEQDSFECFDCGAEFNSRRDKENARCPDCGGIPTPDTTETDP